MRRQSCRSSSRIVVELACQPLPVHQSAERKRKRKERRLTMSGQVQTEQSRISSSHQ